MRIQHNIMAMNSYRNYTSNNQALSKNLEKLSSGYKINRAGDDAAGLAISEKMRAQITGLETAQSNAQSGINLVQTAEGALTEVHDMLNRMVELADQSANGTYDDSTDRDNLQKEFSALSDEIDRIADASNFNGIKLLDGSLGGYEQTSTDNGGIKNMTVSGGALEATDKIKITMASEKATITANDAAVEGLSFKIYDKDGNEVATTASVTTNALTTGEYTYKAVIDDAVATVDTKAKYSGVTGTFSYDTTAKEDAAADVTVGKAGKGLTLQIGDTADTYNKITVTVGDMHAAGIGIDGLSIKDQDSAAAAVDKIRSAIDNVSATRGDLGATQNRLEHTINNLSVMTENVQDAEANIRDVDVAKEMMNYTKNNILVQSAQAMLAQANQVPQGVLQLLQ